MDLNEKKRSIISAGTIIMGKPKLPFLVRIEQN